MQQVNMATGLHVFLHTFLSSLLSSLCQGRSCTPWNPKHYTGTKQNSMIIDISGSRFTICSTQYPLQDMYAHIFLQKTLKAHIYFLFQVNCSGQRKKNGRYKSIIHWHWPHITARYIHINRAPQVTAQYCSSTTTATPAVTAECGGDGRTPCHRRRTESLTLTEHCT